MTAYKFVKLSAKKKKKIIQTVARASNEDQRELMRRYKLSFAKGA